MTTPRIVRDTASVLVRLAHADGHIEKAMEGVSAVAGLSRAHPELFTALRNRTVPLERRAAAMEDTLGTLVHPYVLNALLLLQQHEALHHLDAFVGEARKAAERDAGHVHAAVMSAVPMDETERKKLKAILEKKTGGTVDLEETVDGSVLAGLTVDVGERRVDASVRGSLERLNITLST